MSHHTFFLSTSVSHSALRVISLRINKRKAEFSERSLGSCLRDAPSRPPPHPATYLVLGLASETVTFETVLVPQLLAALLTGHQHVQVADGELGGGAQRTGSRGCRAQHL